MVKSHIKNLKELGRKASWVLQNEGVGKTLNYTGKYLLYGKKYFDNQPFSNEAYWKWIKTREKLDTAKIKNNIKKLAYRPKFSVVTPVYNVDPQWLDKCVNSVLNQFYPDWELCLYDDASTCEDTLKTLKKWQNYGDARIKVAFGKQNLHISGASNRAFKIATGEFIALLDNDDKLSPDALYECALFLNENPHLDYIYSDEDKISPEGKRIKPFFKPDWSPDLFLSMFYFCHLSVFRKSILEQIGGFRKGFEGSQDYDLALRFIEKTDAQKIAHIPKILYHWRQTATSTSAGLSAKDYATQAGRKAIEEHLKRNKIAARVEEGFSPSRFRLRRKIAGQPKVSIVIAAENEKIAEKCSKSILKKTAYRHFDIVTVAKKNESALPGSSAKSSCQCAPNPVAMYNYAVSRCKDEYILFLDENTIITDKNWLDAMLEQIQRPEIGAVGAKIVGTGNKVWQAGIYLAKNGPKNAFQGVPTDKEGYMSLASVIRDVSAVSACLMTKKSLLKKVGGFNEKLPLYDAQIDFCLKLQEKGYRIVYTPHALVHYRENTPSIPAKEKASRLSGKDLPRDPYYNPNLEALEQ